MSNEAADISPVSSMSGTIASPSKAYVLNLASLQPDPKGPPLNILTNVKGRRRGGELHSLDHINRRREDGWKLIHKGIPLHLLSEWFDMQVCLRYFACFTVLISCKPISFRRMIST